MNCPKCGFGPLSSEARFCRKCGFKLKWAAHSEEGSSSGRRPKFSDFQIRAWLVDDQQAQVMVHSSPVGDMRWPQIVSVDPGKLESLKGISKEIGMKPHSYGAAMDIGRSLAGILLPSPALSLLVRSLEHIQPPDGLRLRLCLDESLVDLPWEMLYRPDEQQNSLAGFLVLDPRISLVREAPIFQEPPQLSRTQERLVYVGALWTPEDKWEVRPEHHDLLTAVKPLEHFLEMDEEFHPSSKENIRKLLQTPAPFFHYAGHVYLEGARASITCELNHDGSGDFLGSDQLANLLWKAETKVAFFNACNSGSWTFVEPLLKRAKLTTLIGIQGAGNAKALQAFSQKLYSHLALGLSIDEAVMAGPAASPGTRCLFSKRGL